MATFSHHCIEKELTDRNCWLALFFVFYSSSLPFVCRSRCRAQPDFARYGKRDRPRRAVRLPARKISGGRYAGIYRAAQPVHGGYLLVRRTQVRRHAPHDAPVVRIRARIQRAARQRNPAESPGSRDASVTDY